ncbi:ZDHHC11 [Symbiodinium sp. CCMP2592]|nr:ZDHHC11 [Symbiodinium sp. CCMP2592]
MIVRLPSLKWLPCAKEHKVIPQSSRRFYLGSSTSTHSQVVAALVFGFSCGREFDLCAVPLWAQDYGGPSGRTEMPPSLPRRRNAWDCPPSKRQVVTISICIGNAVAFGMFLFPLLYEPFRLIFGIIFGVSFTFTAFFGIVTMTVDPMDINVWRCEEGLAPEHDAMAYCKNCRVNVQLDSKHCWDCNKCVSNYDHHCPWLNTCIGTRNYLYFYIAIWSLLVMLAVSSTADILVIVKHAAASGDSTNPLGLGNILFWLISVVLALLNIPLCFLDSTLVVFHTYLVVLDITTYDYLTGKTSQKKARWKEQREAQAEGRDSDLQASRRVPVFGGAPVANRHGSQLIRAAHASSFVFNLSPVGDKLCGGGTSLQVQSRVHRHAKAQPVSLRKHNGKSLKRIFV